MPNIEKKPRERYLALTKLSFANNGSGEKGKEINAYGVAKLNGIEPNTVVARFRNGWTAKDAATTPVQPRQPRKPKKVARKSKK